MRVTSSVGKLENGNAVGIAGNIFENVIRVAGKRGLGVYHPLGFPGETKVA